jgi:hypothetical protein
LSSKKVFWPGAAEEGGSGSLLEELRGPSIGVEGRQGEVKSEKTGGKSTVQKGRCWGGAEGRGGVSLYRKWGKKSWICRDFCGFGWAVCVEMKKIKKQEVEILERIHRLKPVPIGSG